jgi:sugar lactone lactonase YvrE
LGAVIGIAQMPEVIRNLAFGGPDFRTLYLTPRNSLIKLDVKTPGLAHSGNVVGSKPQDLIGCCLIPVTGNNSA